MIKQRKHFAFKTLKAEGEINPPNFAYLLKNYYFESDGTLKAFPQFKKVVDIQNPHSIFKITKDQYLFCAAPQGIDKLYLLSMPTASTVFITDLFPSYKRMWYVLHRDYVFFSNKYGKGIYNVSTRTVIPWQPSTQLSFSSADEASEYFFADVIEFPNCENLCSFAGRIFGSLDNVLWFTEPIFCHYTKPYNFIEFPDKIISVSATNNQILVCLPTSFYLGTVAQDKMFSLNLEVHQGLEIIPYSSIAYKNMFAFLCSEGIVIIKDNEYNLINKGICDMSIQGEAKVARVSDGRFILGGDNMSLTFKDEIQAEIIKNKT